MNYLPSKKIVVPLLFVLILLFVVFIFLNNEEDDQQIKEPVRVGVEGRVQNIIEQKDSDGDNLANWEEALWKTDPNNPDTDGDGAPDGEEVRSGRNPILAGPDDFIETTESKEARVSNRITSKTGIVAIDLFSRYLDAKGSPDGTLTQNESADIQEAVIDSFLFDLKTSKDLPKFLSKDVTIIETSPSNIKEYGNSLGRIFLKYYEEERFGSPTEILTEALRERNEARANDLKVLAQAHVSIAEEIIKIPTPESLLSIHLNLANSYTRTSKNISALGDLFTDPISSLGALSLFVNNNTLLFNAGENLKEYFRSNNITYTSQEKGYLILK